MSLCIAGAETLRLAVTAFTLAWTHSVEHVRWQEDWRVTPAGLELTAARVEGSGAGGGCREIGAAPGEPLRLTPCG